MNFLIPIAAVIIVSLLSLVGALTLFLKRTWLEKSLLFLVSFSVGALFGDAFLHIIPELIESQVAFASLFILAGIVIFFVLEKFVCWRHCHVSTSKQHPHPVAFMNLIGDGIHNFLDGALIAGSFLASVPLGITTTLAVVLHEIPQELGDFGVLVHAGFSPKKALFYNLLSASIAIIGCAVVLMLGNVVEGISGALLGIAAGGFVYIAGSDLIPELHKETLTRKSFLQFIGIILGIAVMFALLALE